MPRLAYLLTRTVYIHCHDETAHATVSEQLGSIRSLSGKGVSTLTPLEPGASRPTGCVAHSVSASASVLLHVRGRVDMDAEIAKGHRKLDKTRAALDKQRKILAQDGYRARAAPQLVAAEEAKLRDLEGEQDLLAATIRQFELLKLEKD